MLLPVEDKVQTHLNTLFSTVLFRMIAVNAVLCAAQPELISFVL